MSTDAEPRYERDAFRRITAYKARCPWCGNSPLFIHHVGGDNVQCDACDVEWTVTIEAELFVTHADKLATPVPPVDAPENTP